MSKPTCSVDGCGRQMVARKMCGTHYRNITLYGRLEGAPDPTCQGCGRTFQRPGRGGPVPRFCSKECDPARRPRLTTCRCCGELFDRGATMRYHCSTACTNRYRANGGPVDLNRPCAKCGSPIDFRTVGEGGRRRRANAMHCSRCKRKGGSRVSIAEIVARDGTDCALCGIRVDLTIEWPHPLSATRDHVIPWSHGGSDRIENLQLAHSSCNRAKSNKLSA